MKNQYCITILKHSLYYYIYQSIWLFEREITESLHFFILHCTSFVNFW